MHHKQNGDFIDKTFLYVKDLYEPQHQFLKRKWEEANLKPLHWIDQVLHWILEWYEQCLQQNWIEGCDSF